MKTKSTLILTLLLLSTTLSQLQAGEYYALCEGNFSSANSSLWSFDESFSTVSGPLIWDANTNPLGDVGQSLTLNGHTLYVVMNNSHTIRIIDLENGPTHIGDIDLSGDPNDAYDGASPRFMAIQASHDRGFISSWHLGGLLVIDLNTHTIQDTIILGSKPEELLIDGDRLFISMALQASWAADNRVIQMDISTDIPAITATYTVLNGPGSMALVDSMLYVSSLAYDANYAAYTGTSRINLADGTVVSKNHGTYNNYTADLDVIDGIPYRVNGNSIVPLNDDLSFSTTDSIGDLSGIYSFSVQNDNIVLATSNYVAPDTIHVLSLAGNSLASLTVGAIPGDVLYYDPEFVAIDETIQQPTSTRLYNNYPNPFNPTTNIPFRLDQQAHAKLEIFDTRGRHVNTLLNKHLTPGSYHIVWNGKSHNGSAQSSGIYFAILTSGTEQSVIKMNLIK